MRILFLHPVFPGQFHRLMAHLAARPGHEILHLSRQSAMESVPGVRKFQYKVPEVSSHGHPFASRASILANAARVASIPSTDRGNPA